VQLSGSTDAGHQSLRNALDDLRRVLQQSGFTNCSLDLRQGTAGDPGARGQTPGARPEGTGTPAAATNEPVVPTAPRILPDAGSRRLDLHV
jgi:Tfp pilus assembly protein PilW